MSHSLNAYELEDIRTSYEEELAGLTFNSKPIINMLTTIAQENLNAASVICRTIEDRVRMAPPHQKLPVMYLLDSISKNVGSPFTPIFGRNLYKTFMDCYTSVDSNTRRALEALFSTWKLPVAGSSSPIPVYASEDTRKIDDALMRMRAIQDRGMGYNQYGTPPLHYGRASPVPDPYGYPQARQSSVPVGPDVYRQTPPYRQSPEAPVRNPLAESIIADIGGLLRTLDTRARLNPQDATTLKFITTLRGLHNILTTQNLRPLQLEDIRNSLREVAAFAAQPVQQAPRFASETFQPPPMDLFRQLANAGMIPASGSNTPLALPNLQPTRPVGIYIELSSAAMLTSRPELIDILYTSMPLQCYQCGQRWRDTPEDRAAKDIHLDLHFKTNKRLREHAVRSQSRALYLSESDWIHFTLSDDSAAPDTQSIANGKAVDVSTSTVPKPSDPDLHDSVCPICKETFDTDWDDTNEQWVWKNAVDVNGVIYHATCHAETLAVQKRENAAKMVKAEAGGDDTVESEDEDIALPGTTKKEDSEPVKPVEEKPVMVKQEKPVKKEDTDIATELFTTVKADSAHGDAPSTILPEGLAAALKSLSGGLNLAPVSPSNGNKRKASEDAEGEEERRVKRESSEA